MKKAAWLFLVVLGCGRLWADTLYVDLDSPAPASPFGSWETAATNIQDAVDASTDGDVIQIADGHYLLSAEVSVSGAITLQSVNGPESTIVDGQGSVRCFNLGGSACVIEGLTITNGYGSGHGGGIYCDDTIPVITNCIISGNSVSGYPTAFGGGVYGGTVNNCTICGNSALSTMVRVGGGLAGSIANNCLISGNSAGVGGGMSGETANNCTIIGNSASNFGGGVNRGNVNNSIIWYNEAPDGNDLDSEYVTAFYSCSPDVTHGVDGNITNAPMLIDEYHMSTNSPCCGAGSNDYVSGTDMDGDAWLYPPSMGCDEIEAIGPIYIGIGCDVTAVLYDTPISFIGQVDGVVSMWCWDFGDGTSTSNVLSVEHSWSSEGSYDVVLTAFNNTWPDGVSVTQAVTVLGLADFTIHVSPFGDDAADGLSWATAKQSVQAGVDAQDLVGGSVLVSNGTYALSEQILVEKDIIVRSVNGPESTIIDGQGSVRCFNLKNSACIIDGFTITNGYNVGEGGGIRCSGGMPVVTNCIISGNTAGMGGGMFYGRIYDSEICGNTATDAGGGLCVSTAVGCRISGNTSGYHGGGMSEGVANGCTIIGNTADYYGGGMHLGNVINCLLSNNSAYYGGGLFDGTADSCVVIENIAFWGGGILDGAANSCMITSNTAYYGGGMHSYLTSDCAATNCTIVGNTAIFQAGGIGAAKVNNCIVYYNTSPDGDNLKNVDVFYSCSPDLTNGVNGNITNAPMLLWSSHIAADSPCRGAGSVNYLSGTDIDGEAWSNPPSMGCDEPLCTATGALHVAIALNAEEALSGYPVRFCADIDGIPSRLVWNFAAGSMVTNDLSPEHAWETAGSQVVILTAYNDSWAAGVSATQMIAVVAEENLTNSAVYVAVDGDDANDGLSWASAKETIQSAIDDQYAGGLVLVGPGTYAGGIVLGKGITVQGADGPELTIIDGMGSGRCFGVDDSVCTISGLTIANGNTEFNGGGIYCAGGNTTVTNCIIRQCHAKWNGGGLAGCGVVSRCSIVSNTVGTADFDHGYGGGEAGGYVEYCTISGNWAAYGGGGTVDAVTENCIIMDNSAERMGGGISFGIMANNCTISNNTAKFGGGVYNSLVKNCMISSNTAQTGGGMNHGTANSCTVRGNVADNAGGMWYVTADNCMVSGNTAQYIGGGMYCGSANNCTVSGNSAGNNGGGMYDVSAYNCIVWYNESKNKSNFAYGGSAGYSCSPDLPDGVRFNTTNAPCFVDYENGDYRLMSNSPCINWGENTYVSNLVDVAGNPRIVGDYVDMGAYEFQRAPASDRDGDGMDDDWERSVFGVNADGASDNDGDAFCNADEYIAGTDPTNSASFFTVTNAAPASGFVVQWSALEGRYYSVLWTDCLTNSCTTLQDNLEYPQNSYTDTVHSAESAGFYQVEVRLK
ncbi:MAG: PKD domain-containing protein [Pontiellaceae bacterium]|nr:PKD domain-containing protein [Pontiellaceae bacterium]MBN2786332.1 PKD domain-containing protein [Pontiellaceae bacterium]